MKEVRVELTKVSWSTRDELIGATLVVIVVTVIIGTFIGVLDLILTKFLRLLY